MDKNILSNERPICSCGEKMTLVKFKGYYDTFSHWACYECSLNEKIQEAKPDKIVKGAYEQ